MEVNLKKMVDFIKNTELIKMYELQRMEILKQHYLDKIASKKKEQAE